jgi:hypothetical protein
MIPKRPDGDWSTMGYSPNGATKETRIPEFVWDTCHFCGGEEAEKTEVYVEHLQAVAKLAVETLKDILNDSLLPPYDTATVGRALREIQESGWQP